MEEGAATSSVPRDAPPRLSGSHSDVALGGVMSAPRGLLAIAILPRGDLFAVEQLRGSGSRAVGFEQSIEQMSSSILEDVDGSQMLLAEGKSLDRFPMSEIVSVSSDLRYLMTMTICRQSVNNIVGGNQLLRRSEYKHFLSHVAKPTGRGRRARKPTPPRPPALRPLGSPPTTGPVSVNVTGQF